MKNQLQAMCLQPLIMATETNNELLRTYRRSMFVIYPDLQTEDHIPTQAPEPKKMVSGSLLTALQEVYQMTKTSAKILLLYLREGNQNTLLFSVTLQGEINAHTT